MANIGRIDELVGQVGREPDFVRGYKPRDCHLSGALREAAENYSGLPNEVISLLDEAAETLDDAHQDWLELVRVCDSLLNDIYAMKYHGRDDNVERYYGDFSFYDDVDDGGVLVSWPNLYWSSDKLAVAIASQSSGE